MNVTGITPLRPVVLLFSLDQKDLSVFTVKIASHEDVLRLVTRSSSMPDGYSWLQFRRPPDFILICVFRVMV